MAKCKSANLSFDPDDRLMEAIEILVSAALDAAATQMKPEDEAGDADSFSKDE